MTGGLGDVLLSIPLALILEEQSDLTVVVNAGPQHDLIQTCVPRARLLAWRGKADLFAVARQCARNDLWIYTISCSQRKFRTLSVLFPHKRKLGFTALTRTHAWQADIGLNVTLIPNFAEPAWKNNLRLYVEAFGEPTALLKQWHEFSAITHDRIGHKARFAEREPGLVIHAGSNRYPSGFEKYKRWPVSRFAEVVRRSREQALWPCAYWFFGPEDEELRSEVEVSAEVVCHPEFHRMVSYREFNSSLVALAGFLGAMKAMVTNDTGIAHLATLMGTPLVSIASGTGISSYTGQNGPHSTVVEHITPCKGCALGFSAAMAEKFSCFNDWACMDLISTDRVFDALRSKSLPNRDS
jgi:ADP-heptose:LPS heptosyltransferase